MIVTIPLSRSSTIREIRATERTNGDWSDVTVLFVRGGGEKFPVVFADDLNAVINATTIGAAYWGTFRKKYKSPERIEEPALCGAWISGDDGHVESVCNNVVPCETHREERK